MDNQLKNEGLINVNSNSPGVYVCKIIYKKGQEMSRVYIPGIHVNPINPDDTLNEAIYAENENSYLLCLWESKAMRDAIPEDKVLSGWIQYCTGDQCFGVIMGYMGQTLIEANSWSGGSGSSNSSYISGSGSTSNMNLVGGQIVDALFTAYYATPDNYSSAENILQGGPIAANGETLDYTKLTCAAPSDIPFDTNIQVMDTGTDRDGVIYRVNDRGGAINVVNGVYHFDLLMKDKQTAYDFGKRTGKAMIGGQLVMSAGYNGGVAVGSGGTVSNSGCPDANVYSLSKDGNKALSTNFKVSEFACHNGDDKILIVPELVTLLENIKSSCNGASITINSGYRSPAYNASIGGASHSMHIYGAAADIVVSGYTPTQVYNIFRQIMPNSGGGGIYSSFTHVDVRYNKADW